MSPALVNVSVAACLPFPALLLGERVLALNYWREAGISGAASITGILGEWRHNAPILRSLCDAPDTADAILNQGVPHQALHLHAPVAPRQVFCTIGNYRAQLVEAALDADDGPAGAGAPARRRAVLEAIEQRRRHGEPYVCLKSSACVAGPRDTLAIPAGMETLDWEVEIGVVIGRRAWQIDAAQALDHVAGYCVVNDITLRERVFRQDQKPLGTDWLQSKGHPGWLPAGPWLVPAWALPDPARLRPRLCLNGRTMQAGEASDMIFDIAAQIAYLSRHTVLSPGDLICTGSPAGFGSHYGRYLRPGDVVEAGADGLGTQRVRCTAAPRIPSTQIA